MRSHNKTRCEVTNNNAAATVTAIDHIGKQKDKRFYFVETFLKLTASDGDKIQINTEGDKERERADNKNV